MDEPVAWTQNTFCKYCHRIPNQCNCTHPVKEEHFEDEPQAEELHEIMQSNAELTDEEINKIYLEKYDGHMGFLSPDEVREFARAILRKAQE